jgi:subtilisin family serine protease
LLYFCHINANFMKYYSKRLFIIDRMEKKTMKHRMKISTAICFTAIVLFAIHIMAEFNQIEEKQTDYADAKGQIIVAFNEKITDNELSSLITSMGTNIEVISHIDDYALIFVKEAEEFDNVIEKLNENSKVEVSEANGNFHIMDFTNDSYAVAKCTAGNYGNYSNLLDIGKTKKVKNTGIAENVEKMSEDDFDMDVVEARNQFNNKVHPDREVVVAVVDTGVDYTHPDLAANMWKNTGEVPGDGIDNDGNGYIDDIYGWDFYNGDATVCHYKNSEGNELDTASPDDNDDHGTHIAGIIGAVANNIGITGIASNVNIKIMSLKINGGRDGKGTISDAIEAIKYATMMGADICNISWGTGKYIGTLEQIMKESDMLFVAAAGNSGTDNDNSPIYPANFELDNMISVTFINSNGALARLSNYGFTTVEIAAPGQNIFSTVVGSYGFMSGSSMAAPQVSGVAALLYAFNNNLYASNVKQIIIDNIKSVPGLKGYIKYAGIPDAYNAVLHSGGLLRDTEAPLISFSTLYNYNKEAIQVPIIISDAGGSGIRIIEWMPGEETIKEFQRGTKGNTLKNNELSADKEGMYTVYASDYAGNETIETCQVKDDTTAPKITLSYNVAANYKSRTITVKVKDTQSGIKSAEYMLGSRKANEFLPAESGLRLKLKDDKVSFNVEKDGNYTIYACDNRGNHRAKVIAVRTVKVESIRFPKAKFAMNKKEKYRLRVIVKPQKSTDKITYVSSDKKIATVSSTGVVTALRKGKVRITVRTSSKKTAVCTITVTD